MKTETTPRIAILGRPGPAREHLRHALVELGGEIIAEGDPAELTPSGVLEARPSVVVVSLDAAMEDQLDAWDALINVEGISVIFDEAETTSRLDGWDLARWARHLAAKILGHEQTLPPTPVGAEALPGPVDWIPSPGGPVSPAMQMDAERLEDYTSDSIELASMVPVGDMPNGNDLDAAEGGWEVDRIENTSALDEPVDPQGTSPGSDMDESLLAIDESSGLPGAVESNFSFEVDDDAGEIRLELVELPDGDEATNADPDDGFERLAAGEKADDDAPGVPGYDFSGLDDDLDAATDEEVDADIAALAAQMDSYETVNPAHDAPDLAGLEFDGAGEPDEADPPDDEAAIAGGGLAAPPGTDPGDASTSEPQRPRDYSFGGPLSLLSDEEESAAPATTVAPTPAPTLSIDALTAGLQLESTDEELSRQGVVVLLSGMGGPDALRQFLSALEPDFPVPVLVWQQLNAGTHDRLASQLGKTGRVKTYVAAVGAPVSAGEVGILPPEIGLSAAGGLHFVKDSRGPEQLFAGLAPLGERAVVVALSGSEASWLEGVSEWVESGGTVLTQDPDTCFEASTCQALAQSGYRSAAPAKLAVDALSRWYQEY